MRWQDRACLLDRGAEDREAGVAREAEEEEGVKRSPILRCCVRSTPHAASDGYRVFRARVP